MVNGLLSVLIVNFKAADMLQDCIKSITEQNVAFEVIIVDNNSGEHDRNILESLQSKFPFLKLIFNKVNTGFSKANNQALAVSRGEYILFLNPDTLIFPSCLSPLMSFLKTAQGAGAVIPKLWMDKEKTFLLPPSYLPSAAEIVQRQLSMSSNLLLNFSFDRWLRKALMYWNSDTPLTVSAISGAFILTTKKVMDGIGSFDERFPLYFEDSDLCNRIKKAGQELYYYPHAEAVHLYNQSAKSSPESLEKFALSERLYMEKYFHPFVIKALSRIAKLPMTGAGFSYKVWDFSKPINAICGGHLFFSPLKSMMPCAAHKMSTDHFSFDRQFVENLADGIYYVLLSKPDGSIYEKLSMEKLQER
ncbi:MAG: glycosyltransferase family 2 protein [Thermodesulfovibrionales bacterium]